MIKKVKEQVKEALRNGLIVDGLTTYTGDNIAITLSHKEGINSKNIHSFAWNCFLEATDIAKTFGLYGAGHDLLVDAPSGNIRGAGSAVAEIEFERDVNSKHCPAEAFLVFTADKCGPGAYNLPLYQIFCGPMHDGGLLLNPKMRKGFNFNNTLCCFI